jgi:hypothetical protein
MAETSTATSDASSTGSTTSVALDGKAGAAAAGAAASSAAASMTTTAAGGSETSSAAGAKPAAETTKPAEGAKPPVEADKTSVLGESGKKPAEAATSATEAKPGETPAKAADVPVSYTLKFSDDVAEPVRKDVTEHATGIARELKLSNEQAQLLADKGLGYVRQIAEEAAKEQRRVWDATNEKWTSEVYSHYKTASEEAFKGSDVNQRIGALIDEFGKDIPTLRQDLTFTGAGNKLSLVRFFDKISQVLSEGKLLSINTSQEALKGVQRNPTKASILYDNSNNKGA